MHESVIRPLLNSLTAKLIKRVNVRKWRLDEIKWIAVTKIVLTVSHTGIRYEKKIDYSSAYS